MTSYFLACPHTCKHIAAVDGQGPPSVRPAELRRCFIYKLPDPEFREHIESAAVHPKCTLSCPANRKFYNAAERETREVSEKEWTEWGSTLLSAYPECGDIIRLEMIGASSYQSPLGGDDGEEPEMEDEEETDDEEEDDDDDAMDDDEEDDEDDEEEDEIKIEQGDHKLKFEQP